MWLGLETRWPAGVKAWPDFGSCREQEPSEARCIMAYWPVFWRLFERMVQQTNWTPHKKVTQLNELAVQILCGILIKATYKLLCRPQCISCLSLTTYKKAQLEESLHPSSNTWLTARTLNWAQDDRKGPKLKAADIPSRVWQAKDRYHSGNTRRLQPFPSVVNADD